MHENHRARVRERYFADGLENMDDIAVLEMLLFYCIPRKDTNPLAHKLIEQFGSLSGVLEASPDSLKNISGIGDNAVAFLTMLPKVCKRYITGTLSEKSVYIDDNESVMYFLKSLFIGLKEEMLVFLSFDGCGRLTNTYEVTGKDAFVDIDIKDMTDFVLSNRTKSVILAHNHPDGPASPSRSDIEATDIIKTELNKIGVSLTDHVIFGADGLLSMRSTKNFSKVFENG